MTDTQIPDRQDAPVMAAIDMGSNSFHMVIARSESGEVRPIQKLAEKVMLATGLTSDNQLDEAAFSRGTDCLRRFAQCLEGIDPKMVRCVGTNTLRKAQNGYQFLREARKILNCPVEVVAGREEARLIYLGVSHFLAAREGHRLVFDIGGGSTEFIVGKDFEPLLTESLHMGCVSYRQLFFSDGKITEAGFRKAVIKARIELSTIDLEYKKLGWESAVGSSGTVKAVKNALIENGLYEDGITLQGLYELRKKVLQFKLLDDLNISGVKPDRRSVFPSGLAIMIAIFEQLGVDKARFSEGAMREGILYDLLGRHAPEDVRERTIRGLMNRCAVDIKQAERVEATALTMFDQVKMSWDLGDFCHDWLRWAALSHEVGLMVSHSGFHKHSSYLLSQSDLPGFTRQDQQIMAALVASHRRRIRENSVQQVPVHLQDKVFKLILLLRLSTALHRSRREDIELDFALKVEKNQLTLKFPADWIAQQPLLYAELQQEQEAMKKVGYQLDFE